MLRSALDWVVLAFSAFVAIVVDVVWRLGYLGLIILMTLESSFMIPCPSEIVIPPAGYLSAIGEMNLLLVIVCGTLGSFCGASLNYFIAKRFGRAFFVKYGRYIFLKPEHLNFIDGLFRSHGEIITFIARLIPGVRKYISLPAGLAAMRFSRFAVYTIAGALIWVTILAFVGRLVGNNIELVQEHIGTILLIMLPIVILVVISYILIHRRIKRNSNTEA